MPTATTAHALYLDSAYTAMSVRQIAADTGVAMPSDTTIRRLLVSAMRRLRIHASRG